MKIYGFETIYEDERCEVLRAGERYFLKLKGGWRYASPGMKEITKQEAEELIRDRRKGPARRDLAGSLFPMDVPYARQPVSEQYGGAWRYEAPRTYDELMAWREEIDTEARGTYLEDVASYSSPGLYRGDRPLYSPAYSRIDERGYRGQ